MNIDVVKANYSDEQHGQALVMLLNSYASEPMGGGEPLSDQVKSNLVATLSELPHAFSVLAYVDGQPAGLVNCFEAFSTFQCKPIVNIHDVVVLDSFRGLGVSQLMMAKVEAIARDKGCCKITLEVLEGNTVAKNAYIKFGFDGYELDPVMGKAMFWEKKL